MNQIPGSMLIQFNIANNWDTFQAGYGKKKKKLENRKRYLYKNQYRESKTKMLRNIINICNKKLNLHHDQCV